MSEYAEATSVFEPKFEELINLIKASRRLRIFTGAGVSTLSGIPDFRGAHGVYTDPWHGMDVEDIISLDFFHERPDIFYQWAKDVWYRLEDYDPNIVHRVIAKLEEKKFTNGVYTQNIDLLHQRAGSKAVYEIHGSPSHHYCTECGKHYAYGRIAPLVRAGELPICDQCGGVIKPDIVFYGENLNGNLLNRAWEDFGHADLCLVLGSSLTVQPAASLPRLTAQGGGKIVIVNAQPTDQDRTAALRFQDLAQVFEALDVWLEDQPPRT